MRETNIDKGYTCPHCGGFVKRYTRTLNSNMAIALMLMYRRRHEGYIKVEDALIESGYHRCGDFSYMTHYGFIEKKPADRLDGSKRNGFYRITERGILFAEGKIAVPERFSVIHNKLQYYSGNLVKINDVLGRKFNYLQMMNTHERTI